jgi:hypothetical protein
MTLMQNWVLAKVKESGIFEVCVTVHHKYNKSKRTNLMQLHKIIYCRRVMALHVSGVCAHRQEQQVLYQQHMVFCKVKRKNIRFLCGSV